MKMSLLYSNLPVYVGTANATGITENSAYLPATQVNVSYNTNSSPKRNLGVTVATGDQYKTQQGLNTTISMSCFLQKSLQESMVFCDALYNDAYFPIKIGDNTFHKCYPNSISVNVAPYQPVTLKADFVSLDPPTGTQISPDETPYTGGTIPFDANEIIYGHTCAVSNMNTVVGNVQSQISYQKTYSRSPVYKLGSINATNMLLDGVEEQMSISSTGLNNLIDFSGDVLNSEVKVDLTSETGQTIDYIESLSMKKGATVSTEDYSVAGGDTLQTVATIKQVTL